MKPISSITTLPGTLKRANNDQRDWKQDEHGQFTNDVDQSAPKPRGGSAKRIKLSQNPSTPRSKNSQTRNVTGVGQSQASYKPQDSIKNGRKAPNLEDTYGKIGQEGIYDEIYENYATKKKAARLKKGQQSDVKLWESLLVFDVFLIVGVIVLLVASSSCSVENATNDPDSLDEFFGNISADIRPSQTPPLNQFEPPDSSNEGSEQGNSLSSSYDSSYGSYPPNNDGSGSSVGSNSPSYSNSFGSSSLDDANSQYSPSPTEYSFTTTRRPPNVHYPSASKLFGHERPNEFTGYLEGKPTFGTSTAKIREDIWMNRDFQCGVQSIKPSTRVVGGSIAVKHSWPWIGNVLEIQPNGIFEPICGSTIVSPRHAISATHCFSLESEEYKLAVGKHDGALERGVEQDIVRIRRHPYARVYVKVYYDLALLTVRNELQFGTKVQPACLPSKDTPVKPGRMCWAYGWGVTVNTGGKGFLKQVQLEIGSPEKCIEEYGKEADQEYAVCAGMEVGQDTCREDSGGPLTCMENDKWVVYGATSYGDINCGSGKLAVYAAISFSMNWLCCFLDALPECQNIACDALDFRHPVYNK